MKLFVYEYATAIPALDVPEAIRREGRAMFDAVCADALALSDVQLLTMDGPQALHEREQFQRHAAAADWTLVIAPETAGVLLERAMWVKEAGGNLLGPTPEAILATGDKWETYVQWRSRGVPTPMTWVDGSQPPTHGALLRKLRDGAGSQAMRFSPPELVEAADPRWLWQAFVPGQPVSVAFLLGPDGKSLHLLPAAQHLATDGSFHYLGGAIPLEPALARRAVRLAHRAIEGIVGLFGFVGVDLVLGEEAAGQQDYAIEINPRLTTSYVGLRSISENNLLGNLLAVATGQVLPPLAWKHGRMTFTASGLVEWA